MNAESSNPIGLGSSKGKSSREIYFAMSRKARKAEIMDGFICFEHLQGAFHCGILLSDGTQADGIGRTKTVHDFLTRAGRSNIEVVTREHTVPAVELPAKLEIQANKQWAHVSWYIFRSWTGKRRVDGKRFHGPVFYLGSNEQAV